MSSASAFEPAAVDDLIQTIARLPNHDAVNFSIGLEITGGRLHLRARSANVETWSRVEVPLTMFLRRLEAQARAPSLAFIALRQTPDAIVGWNPRSTAGGLVETIVSEWRLFTNNKPPEDDVSVAVIVLGRNGAISRPRSSAFAE